MAFDTFDQRTRQIAERALAHCRHQFGGAGMVTEKGISADIAWRPTFYCKPTPTLIVAVEVDELLYPEVLKGAAHDIGFYDAPIAVYQACSLESYQNDKKQIKINALRQHGFGIITVDEDGLAVIQHRSVPLAQHMAPEHVEAAIKPLTAKLKVAFRAAYDTYKTNIGQGLQQAGQIVEAIVSSISSQEVKNGTVTLSAVKGSVSNAIDSLYQDKSFVGERAELGAARAFINEFRNTASHPAKSAKQAAQKMRSCKTGFDNAISTAVKLQRVSKKHNLKMNVHL